MTRLPVVEILRKGRIEQFHGTWYRGEHTNFLPTKAELSDPNAIDDYIVQGWVPAQPFITKSAPLTAFGSCFAGHITDYLEAKGYNIFGRHLDIHAHIIRFGEGMVNTFSIRQQLEWAAGIRQFPEKMWFGPNKEVAAVDPTIREETYQIIRQTEVFIVTLGLSEIWYDKINGEVFWRAIPADMFDPDRHGFRITSVQENYDNLLAIIAVIRKLRSDARIIFTLSPIPLVATFRPVSCLTANSVSKAILRVAIDQVMREHGSDGGLFYFPSYEIIKDGFIDPFRDDNRHPKPEVIEVVMRTFERHYCESCAGR
jgi:hypothetical protein